MKVRITSLAGLAGSQAPAWEPLPIKLLLVRLPFLGKQELQRPRSQAGAWERAKHNPH